MKQRFLAKQTDSFKRKFDKNVILKYFGLQPSVFCFAGDLLFFFKVLRYSAHYMTVSQAINLK